MAEQQEANAHNYIESKEKIPSTRLGVELVKIGGLGDILHMAKVVGNLSKKEGFQIDVYSNIVTDKYIDICRGEFGNASIITSSQPIRVEPDILITNNLTRDKVKGKLAHIHIEEFSSKGKDPELKVDYIVATGLGFDPKETEKIQAGITDSLTLKKKIEQRTAIKQETRKELGMLLEKSGIAEKTKLEHARIGVLYTSSLSTNFAYIEELSKVAKKIDEPVVIFCVGSRAGGYSLGFDENAPVGKDLRELLKEAPVSFYDTDENDPLEYNRSKESNVSFVNLGERINNDLFQDILLSADFPSVITGDQSLAETIQIASSTGEAPPFLYYCYFGDKANDFLERIKQTSPLAASVAADYILKEEVPEFSSDKLPAVKDIHLQTGGKSFQEIFTDKHLQKEYAKAMGMIPSHLREDKARYIPMADKLVWESDTVNFIIQSIRRGEAEKIELLKPRIPQNK